MRCWKSRIYYAAAIYSLNKSNVQIEIQKWWKSQKGLLHFQIIQKINM